MAPTGRSDGNYGEGLVAAVIDTTTPMIVVAIPSGSIVAGNAAAADLLAVAQDELVGRTAFSFLDPDSQAASELSLDLLAKGVIEGYRAARSLVRSDGTVVAVEGWTRRLSDGLAAVALVVPAETDAKESSRVGARHEVVAGIVDKDWRIQQISAEVQSVLGWRPDAIRGTALLSTMHPEDAADLLTALEAIPVNAGASAVPVRVRDRDGTWRSMECLLVPLSGAGAGRVAFALCEYLDEDPSVSPAEVHRRRMASDLRAAGLLDRADRLPDADRFPQLESLTVRQWDVLGRLLAGDRVPTIAKELYVSQSTVRNHLAAIFRAFDVHSQSELLELLR